MFLVSMGMGSGPTRSHFAYPHVDEAYDVLSSAFKIMTNSLLIKVLVIKRFILQVFLEELIFLFFFIFIFFIVLVFCFFFYKNLKNKEIYENFYESLMI